MVYINNFSMYLPVPPQKELLDYLGLSGCFRTLEPIDDVMIEHLIVKIVVLEVPGSVVG